MRDVRQRLLSIQVLKALKTKVAKWLRSSVESMLKCEEQAAMGRSHHEGIESILSDGAGVLATDIQEDRRSRVTRIEVLVIGPVSLLENSMVLVVEVVDRCFFPELLEVTDIHINVGSYLDVGSHRGNEREVMN